MPSQRPTSSSARRRIGRPDCGLLEDDGSTALRPPSGSWPARRSSSASSPISVSQQPYGAASARRAGGVDRHMSDLAGDSPSTPVSGCAVDDDAAADADLAGEEDDVVDADARRPGAPRRARPDRPRWRPRSGPSGRHRTRARVARRAARRASPGSAPWIPARRAAGPRRRSPRPCRSRRPGRRCRRTRRCEADEVGSDLVDRRVAAGPVDARDCRRPRRRARRRAAPSESTLDLQGEDHGGARR